MTLVSQSLKRHCEIIKCICLSGEIHIKRPGMAEGFHLNPSQTQLLADDRIQDEDNAFSKNAKCEETVSHQFDQVL